MKYKIPKLNSVEPGDPTTQFCYDGSYARTGDAECRDGGALLATIPCHSGGGDGSGCGNGGTTNACVGGNVPLDNFDPNGCLAGTDNPGCGNGASHLRQF
jgi:hypothetical protein